MTDPTEPTDPIQSPAAARAEAAYLVCRPLIDEAVRRLWTFSAAAGRAPGPGPSPVGFLMIRRESPNFEAEVVAVIGVGPDHMLPPDLATLVVRGPAGVCVPSPAAAIYAAAGLAPPPEATPTDPAAAPDAVATVPLLLIGVERFVLVIDVVVPT